jgi:DnaK suppressor protein
MPRATKSTTTDTTPETSTDPTAAGASKPAVKKATTRTPVTKPANTTTAKTRTGRSDGGFLDAQRALLLEERATYLYQAEELKAQADSLALEHEPGDVQFDEEGGEGGTSNVDRELDLVLSGQALAAIEEIDRALLKIDAGTYGSCEQCGNDIPEARLEALPHAALCVACKSGGLSSRR